MKKEDFKTVRSIATIANLSLAMFLSAIAVTVAWIIKRNSETFILMAGFAGLFIICALLALFSSNKLKHIKFEGTAKELAELAQKHAKWVFFPFIFAVTMNRIRSAMWDWYVTEKTSHIEDPVERAKVNRVIIDELHEDGFITQGQYDDRVAKYPAVLQQAELWKRQMEEDEKKRKAEAKKAKTNKKKDKSSDDDWI